MPIQNGLGSADRIASVLGEEGDEGVADLPLTIQLPIGISGATRCNATASVVSVAPRNYDVPGTHSIELRTRP